MNKKPSIIHIINEILLVIIFILFGLQCFDTANQMEPANPNAGLDFSNWNIIFMRLNGKIVIFLAIIVLIKVIKNILKYTKKEKGGE